VEPVDLDVLGEDAEGDLAVQRAASGGFGGLGGTVGGVTDILVRRAVASREKSRAA
jgi:hypothetical protein